MIITSWNVNGIRSCNNKGCWTDFVCKIDPDIICVQETKSDEKTANIALDGYYQYWNPAVKKGYSGTAIFSKYKASSYMCGFNDWSDTEGRVITLSYQEFYLVNCYAPHAQRDLGRIQYKHEFNCALANHLVSLKKQKPVILCGDLNVAHNDIDLQNYKTNYGNAGFTETEREDFSYLLSIGMIDSFRFLYPEQKGAYTWWSYMKDVRKRNIGWRIDYALVSSEICSQVKDAMIYSDVFGSDHCPIGIKINREMNLL